MDYHQAKAAFFQELQYPEEELANHIRAMAELIRSHVEAAYLAKAFDGKIHTALEEVIGVIDQARECARALELPTQEQKYTAWRGQVTALFSEVGSSFSRARIQLPILSGGKRKTHHFLENKLHVDSAIIAIESALDALYRGEISRRRRVYHGAGLLYYLGYETYEAPGPLAKGAPFQGELSEGDLIHRRYRSRRAEARKYLSAEAVRDLMRQAIRTIEGREKMVAELVAQIE